MCLKGILFIWKLEMDLELKNMQEKIRDVERLLENAKLLSSTIADDLEHQIHMDGVVTLERLLQNLQTELKNNMQLKEYQSFCEHDFVTDLIDIHPDKSMTVVYCRHCHFCK